MGGRKSVKTTKCFNFRLHFYERVVTSSTFCPSGNWLYTSHNFQSHNHTQSCSWIILLASCSRLKCHPFREPCLLHVAARPLGMRTDRAFITHVFIILLSLRMIHNNNKITPRSRSPTIFYLLLNFGVHCHWETGRLHTRIIINNNHKWHSLVSRWTSNCSQIYWEYYEAQTVWVYQQAV